MESRRREGDGRVRRTWEVDREMKRGRGEEKKGRGREGEEGGRGEGRRRRGEGGRERERVNKCSSNRETKQ